VLSVGQPNVQMGTYPTVMIPAFTVPSSIILHVLSLWQLRRLGRKVQGDAR
jgi:cytochrome oxidase assembly protein ShyY1